MTKAVLWIDTEGSLRQIGMVRYHAGRFHPGATWTPPPRGPLLSAFRAWLTTQQAEPWYWVGVDLPRHWARLSGIEQAFPEAYSLCLARWFRRVCPGQSVPWTEIPPAARGSAVVGLLNALHEQSARAGRSRLGEIRAWLETPLPADTVMPWGEYQGMSLTTLVATQPAYVDWVIRYGVDTEIVAALQAARAETLPGSDDHPK